jgi:hypothetical protein
MKFKEISRELAGTLAYTYGYGHSYIVQDAVFIGYNKAINSVNKALAEKKQLKAERKQLRAKGLLKEKKADFTQEQMELRIAVLADKIEALEKKLEKTT